MRKYLYLLVILIGLLQPIGYLLGNKSIKGIGQASGSSPLPIVFTEVKGVETFASNFYIQFINNEGNNAEYQITPHLYSKLKGPYNRRNIYGCAISYGPILKKEIWESILNYGICGKVLLKEMGLPLTGKNYSIRIKTKTSRKNDEWILKPNCSK
jgi:hypothetical protein